MNLEVEAAKKVKPSLSDDSKADADAIPKRHPRPKPLAELLVSEDKINLSDFMPYYFNILNCAL